MLIAVGQENKGKGETSRQLAASEVSSQVLLVQHQTPGEREPFGYPFEVLVEVSEADKEANTVLSR